MRDEFLLGDYKEEDENVAGVWKKNSAPFSSMTSWVEKDAESDLQ
jgi:hypothetical protein